MPTKPDRRSNPARAAHDASRRVDWLAARAVLAGLVAAVAFGCGGGSESSANAAPASNGAAADIPAEGATTEPNGGVAPAAPVEMQTEVVRRLDEARALARNCGTERFEPASAVSWNPPLEQAASAHAEWMQASDTVSHTGANGSSVANRVDAVGYRWQAVGENIAAGQADVATVVAGWLASPGHCRNIMNPAFVDAALAMKPGTSANRYRSYWVLILARPR